MARDIIRDRLRYKSDCVISDIVNENKILSKKVKLFPYNKEVFNQGVLWEKSGLPLDEAPDNKRYNSNFVRGFEHSKRLSEINESFYGQGYRSYTAGLMLENIPDKLKSNEFFIKGYEDAKNGIRKVRD